MSTKAMQAAKNFAKCFVTTCILLAKQLRLKSKAVSFAQLLLVGAHSGA